MSSSFIHSLADVAPGCYIGNDTRIWQFCVILSGARIGRNCNICAHVLIEGNTCIGDDVTIKSGVQLWEGITVEDKVFIGPNVTFTNDLIPRSKDHSKLFVKTLLKNGCSIGANATILAGVEIGSNALIGAGSVVTKNIPDNTVWYGNPARQKGFITAEGILLDMNKKDSWGKEYKI